MGRARSWMGLPHFEELSPMGGGVERSNPHWGLDLPSHSGGTGVATRFSNYENVSRTEGWLLILLGRFTPSVETFPRSA